ncbi:hypothetical protein HMPREF0762_01591 [Slackia exigua ATCC 700122]|uniref:Uncharacterized protein n=1 Tax=Slackia exigua (strain ATCC 700122 / DSM 15923 / CIP 105133 / JCM 11022 / KCTC 5966 / S-7) TaxID=649764 RepID=D0WIB6_SLAES|nr:hypothetical protein HMPREF0762_01591 [Slackia exigua ATCC 700122]
MKIPTSSRTFAKASLGSFEFWNPNDRRCHAPFPRLNLAAMLKIVS